MVHPYFVLTLPVWLVLILIWRDDQTGIFAALKIVVSIGTEMYPNSAGG